jgi:hypothetical protein
MANHPAGLDTRVDQTLGHYRIVKKLGGGGMGVVPRPKTSNVRKIAYVICPPHISKGHGPF